MKMRLFLSLILVGINFGGVAMATEEPEFKLVLQDGAFEVRDYPALIVAEVSVAGERSEAVSAGFRLLAAYIFGGNTRRQSIAMTAVSYTHLDVYKRQVQGFGFETLWPEVDDEIEQDEQQGHQRRIAPVWLVIEWNGEEHGAGLPAS